MKNLELKNYAKLSIEYHNIDRNHEPERNAFFNDKLNPYWDHFGETDVSLTTVIFSHVNDIVFDRKNAAVRAEFVKWLLWRYPNTENVSILANAEFAEFQEEMPQLFK